MSEHLGLKEFIFIHFIYICLYIVDFSNEHERSHFGSKVESEFIAHE